MSDEEAILQLTAAVDSIGCSQLEEQVGAPEQLPLRQAGDSKNDLRGFSSEEDDLLEITSLIESQEEFLTYREKRKSIPVTPGHSGVQAGEDKKVPDQERPPSTTMVRHGGMISLQGKSTTDLAMGARPKEKSGRKPFGDKSGGVSWKIRVEESSSEDDMVSGSWRKTTNGLTDSQESGSSDEIPASPEPSMGKFRTRVRQTPGQRLFPIFNMGKIAGHAYRRQIW